MTPEIVLTIIFISVCAMLLLACVYFIGYQRGLYDQQWYDVEARNSTPEEVEQEALVEQAIADMQIVEAVGDVPTLTSPVNIITPMMVHSIELEKAEAKIRQVDRLRRKHLRTIKELSND